MVWSYFQSLLLSWIRISFSSFYFFNVCYVLFFSSLCLKINWWESDNQPELRCYLHWSQMVQLERDFHYWRTIWLSFHQPVTRRRREKKKETTSLTMKCVCARVYNWSMGFSLLFFLFSLSFCMFLYRTPTASSSTTKRVHSFNVKHRQQEQHVEKKKILTRRKQAKQRVGHKKTKKKHEYIYIYMYVCTERKKKEKRKNDRPTKRPTSSYMKNEKRIVNWNILCFALWIWRSLIFRYTRKILLIHVEEFLIQY